VPIVTGPRQDTHNDEGLMFGPMAHFPPRLVALPCALLCASLLASCASERPDDESARSPTTHLTTLTPEASPTTTGAGGSGTNRPPKQTPAPKQRGTARQTPQPPKQLTPEADVTPLARADAADPTRTRVAPSLPSGSDDVLDGRRMVALYGAPGTSSLGALGEQSLDKSVQRVKRLAKTYDGLTEDDVVPTFELIATVAATKAGPDKDFSSELSLPTLRPWVERAAREGVYVVLDLQPGRTDFVRQAQRYAPLLKYPHVGLALDPEWRLGPKERHLEQIGSVHAREVNATIDWLAGFTRRHDLPQKLLIVHQFRPSMVTDRTMVRTGSEAVSVVIHADGQGRQSAKRQTWTRLHKGAPDGVGWGWKNFIDEDQPMLTPKQTYRIRPAPDFVSYQ